MQLTLENKLISIYDPVRESTYESKLIDHIDEWTVLFFYPADFSIVCPTELQRLQEYKQEFKQHGARVLVISRDSHYTHQQWVSSDEHLKNFNIEMVSDRDAEIGKELCINLVNEKTKNYERVTMIIDKIGNILSFDLYPEKIGRNVEELLRKIKAMRYVLDNPDTMCPEKREGNVTSLQDTIHEGTNTMFTSNT